ncbi:MAG: DUF3302 domain-containing protein [Myxococcota bacterium]|nr:DUF3302 domain-containing protein [Myxococcota bacterium]
MTLPSFIILSVIAIIAVTILIELATLPGRKARERGHLQAEAINILAWLGLVTGGPGWVVAMVWAYLRPGGLIAIEPGHEAPATAPPGKEKAE